LAFAVEVHARMEAVHACMGAARALDASHDLRMAKNKTQIVLNANPNE
jgi:hypothetical protein